MPPPDSPTNAELCVLDVLWHAPGRTVREIANALHGDATAIQYRTVQVLLQRLEKKGLCRCDRSAALSDASYKICLGCTAPSAHPGPVPPSFVIG